MKRNDVQADPYAPPPRYKMKSGIFVRVAILAVLLGLAGVGTAAFLDRPATETETAAIEPTPAPQAQQLADASNSLPPEDMPQATPAQTAPSAPAPERRSTPAPRASAPEPVPPPVTVTEPPPAQTIPQTPPPAETTQPPM